MIIFSTAVGVEYGNKSENPCKIAINEKQNYKVLESMGVHLNLNGILLRSYVLLNEMYRFEVLKKEFQQKSSQWRFEFVEMSGGKTMAFVYHLKNKFDYCFGPNAFLCQEKII